MCDMSHVYVWHDWFVRVIWVVRTCSMTLFYVLLIYAHHDTFTRTTRRDHMRNMTHSYVWHDLFICVTCLVHMCNMTHSYVWHDSFVCVTWHIHMCNMTHSHVQYDTFTGATWHIHRRNKTHSHLRCDTFTCVIRLFHMYAVTQSYAYHDSLSYVTWLSHTCAMWVMIDFSHVWHLWQILGVSINIPHGTQFWGPSSYPWVISLDCLEICKMWVFVRGMKFWACP